MLKDFGTFRQSPIVLLAKALTFSEPSVLSWLASYMRYFRGRRGNGWSTVMSRSDQELTSRADGRLAIQCLVPYPSPWGVSWNGGIGRLDAIAEIRRGNA